MGQRAGANLQAAHLQACGRRIATSAVRAAQVLSLSSHQRIPILSRGEASCRRVGK